MKKILFPLAAVVLLFLLQSCKKDKTYRVHEDFSEYILRFEKEASLRGRSFDFKKSGLIVEFADLKKNLAGLCHDEKPIRIEIDRTYWKKMQQFKGADLICEELIFHELGHGFLGRKHHNAIFENDEWKSLMCGGDSIPGRTWNINYRGIRRNYYLDELFNQNTPTPDFINSTLPIDTSSYKTTYLENFNSTNPDFWKPTNHPETTHSIQNKELIYESQSANNLAIVSNFSTINILNDFCFEFSFRHEGTDPSPRFGLVFGNSSISLDYFLINNMQEITFGNNKWFSYFTKLKNNYIKPFESNHLKVFKNKEMLYFFINNNYVYSTEIEINKSGTNFGFIIPAYSKIYLDNFRLGSKISGQNITAAQNSVKISNPEIEVFEINISESYTKK